MSNSMATRARSHHHRGGRNTHSGGMNNRPNNHTRGGRPEPREPKTEKAAITGVHANPRLMHVFIQLVGCKVTVTTKNNQKYSGLLNSVNRDGNVVLSSATCVTDDNPSSAVGQEIDNIILEKENIVFLEGKALELDQGREFATDQVIAQRSNGQLAGEKELEPWDGGDDDALLQETLEGSSDANGWAAEDMFQCNEEKFSLTSSYNKDLNEYTTPLPSVKDETYRKREQEAARKAQEIEDNEQSRRRYELENGDEDEESKYSAVHRPGAGGMRDPSGGPGKSKSSQGYTKRLGGGMGSRGGRQQHMDGGRGLPARSVAQSQPPTPRSPPKIDSNPPRVNGSRNEAHTADVIRSMGEVPAVSASIPSTLAQGPGAQPPQSQPLQSTSSLSSSQLPPQTQAAPAPSAGAQVRPPLSQSQPSPPIQPAASSPSQAKSPTAAPLGGGGDGAKEAVALSEGQAVPTTGAAAVVRPKTGEFKDFSRNFVLKYNQNENEPAGASTPKEGGATAKEEEPQAEKGATAVEGEKPVEKKKYVLNPNAEEFKPQSKPMPPPAVSQAPTPPRPSMPQSPGVMMGQQAAYMGNYLPYNPAPMAGAPTQPKPARSNQYPQRAVVSMAQPSRQDFSAAAQHATGAPLMAQAAPQFNHHPPYLLPTHPFPQQNMPMLSPHPTRMLNPTSMSLTHQTMQSGADPMQATSQHAMNAPQHMFMPPHGAPIPAHLPSHVPMPAHVTHGMAGQQSQPMQPMTPVTGPPNPGSVQHSVGGHQQPPPSSGTPQPGPMNYAPMNLPSHLGHQNQHTTSPQPMQPYGLATSHAQPQQHLQHGGQQYTFAQSQPASSQAMQHYGSSQPGQHHPTLVMMPSPMGPQFGSHVPMPAHANATPVMPVHSGIPASAASHAHMPFLPHHSQVTAQHGHQGYPQT